MPAPHLPAAAYLALLAYGRALASIVPAEVRPQAERTLGAFTAEMVAGMAVKPSDEEGADHG
jgi:hypothetical protein